MNNEVSRCQDCPLSLNSLVDHGRLRFEQKKEAESFCAGPVSLVTGGEIDVDYRARTVDTVWEQTEYCPQEVTAVMRLASQALINTITDKSRAADFELSAIY